MLRYTHSGLNPYQYKDLTEDAPLRLLKLSAAASKQNELKCELIEISLANKGFQPYEALSWCWGDERSDRVIRMYDHEKDEDFEFMITPNLDSALRGLRDKKKPRYLWVDAICINQKDYDERNSQVPRMDTIYGNAKSVCVWIGETKDNSTQVIKFIKEHILKLWEFDTLPQDPEKANQWKALWRLLQRPWFSRRWVIQEIALAREAMIYCGEDSISWHDFSNAVSLFVEAESNGHHMSSVIRGDKDSNNISDYFGDVSESGAAVLIEATSNLFRNLSDGDRAPMLSLEYLVSKYTIFEATQPRDTVYALLAIAKDTTPKSQLFSFAQMPTLKSGVTPSPSIQLIWRAIGRQKFASKDFRVNYKLPVEEVYKDFVDFCLRQSEPTRALDILCRPWAPCFTAKQDTAGFHEALNGKLDFGRPQLERTLSTTDEEPITLPSWLCDQNEKAFAMTPISGREGSEKRMKRIRADPLVGLPAAGERNYNASGRIGVSMEKLRFSKGMNSYSLFVEGFILDTVTKVEERSQSGGLPAAWLTLAGWTNTQKDPPDSFWRTLVGNRGPDGRNPLPFYRRACQEAVKTLHHGTVLDLTAIIDEGGSSIVAGFLRRVQAVIWGRRLMLTEKGRLGLAHENAGIGDKICILYGCGVPVILREYNVSHRDTQEYRSQKIREYDERLKKAVFLVGEIRKRVLQRRRESPTWQRKVQVARLLNAARSLLLATVVCYLVYLGRWVQLAIFISVVSLTNAREIRRLLPRNWTRPTRLWWVLLKNTVVARVLLFGLLGTTTLSYRGFSLDMALLFILTLILFPRMLLGGSGSTTPPQYPMLIISKVQKEPAWKILAVAGIGLVALTYLGYSTVTVTAATIPSILAFLFLDSFNVYTLVQMHGALKILGQKLQQEFSWKALVFGTPPPLDEAPRFYYEIIGACYVDGMMDGEAIEQQSKDRLKRVVFDLR